MVASNCLALFGAAVSRRRTPLGRWPTSRRMSGSRTWLRRRARKSAASKNSPRPIFGARIHVGQRDKLEVHVERSGLVEADQQTRFADMFAGEDCDQITKSTGKLLALRHDPTKRLRLDRDDQIDVAKLIDFSLAERATNSYSEDPLVGLKRRQSGLQKGPHGMGKTGHPPFPCWIKTSCFRIHGGN